MSYFDDNEDAILGGRTWDKNISKKAKLPKKRNKLPKGRWFFRGDQGRFQSATSRKIVYMVRKREFDERRRKFVDSLGDCDLWSHILCTMVLTKIKDS